MLQQRTVTRKAHHHLPTAPVTTTTLGYSPATNRRLCRNGRRRSANTSQPYVESSFAEASNLDQ